MRDSDRNDGRYQLAEEGEKSSGWRRYWWVSWAFPVVGLVSVVWFLVRVLPKPSRSTYPCQRVAMPLASGFVVWLLGTVGSALAYRHGTVLYRRSRLGKALVCLAIAGVAGIVAIAHMPETPVVAEDGLPINTPIGQGRGIFPGRVVWVHDANATDWGGYYSPEYWYEPQCTDRAVVETMLSNSIRALAGEATDAGAWDAIFRYYNQQRGKGDVGYQAGEKIGIKINLTTCNAANSGCSPTDYNKPAWSMNNIDNSPQLTLALLGQLVNEAGVDPCDISLGDPTCLTPNFFYNMVQGEFPDVHYIDNSGGSGRQRVEYSKVKLYWSTPEADGTTQDYIPESYAEAEYFINFAILKGHSAGITLCGKNHYGSMIRMPTGQERDGDLVYSEDGVNDYYSLHWSLPNSYWSPGIGNYRSIVDLLGHEELGGKTVLYLIDGLFGGYYFDAYPYKWHTPPFNNDWPSSIFVSQDPVAIDSVGYDFLLAEWPVIVSGGVEEQGSLRSGAQDYLHEAAEADDPCSDTFYDPERDGVRMTSLGVHEHWDNPTAKQYSGNLGDSNGIELVALSEEALQENTRGDFVVSLIVVQEGQEKIAKDAVIGVRVTVSNVGGAMADAGRLSVWLDEPGEGDCGSFDRSGRADVGILARGESVEVTFNALRVRSLGDKTFRAFVDEGCLTAESDETNNQATQTYSVVEALADFAITDVSVSWGGADLLEGGTFDVDVTVENQGVVAGDAGSLALWLDKAAAAGCAESGDASVQVGALGMGESSVLSFTDLPAGGAGAKTVRVFVDSDCASAELDESDNQSTAAYQVAAVEELPDILILNRCVLKKGKNDVNEGRFTMTGGSLNISEASFLAADEIAVSIFNESDEALVFEEVFLREAGEYKPGNKGRDGKYTVTEPVKMKLDLDKDSFSISAKGVDLSAWDEGSVIFEIEIGDDYLGVGDN